MVNVLIRNEWYMYVDTLTNAVERGTPLKLLFKKKVIYNRNVIGNWFSTCGANLQYL